MPHAVQTLPFTAYITRNMYMAHIAYMCIHMFICRNAYPHTHVYIRTYNVILLTFLTTIHHNTYVHACMHACMAKYVYSVYTHIYIHIRKHIYTHTYVSKAHGRTYMHVCMQTIDRARWIDTSGIYISTYSQTYISTYTPGVPHALYPCGCLQVRILVKKDELTLEGPGQSLAGFFCEE